MRVISKDTHWHRKVKGWGGTAVDRATNALVTYREKHPEPDGDNRPKLCRTCHEVYDQSSTECPQCGGTTFELMDGKVQRELTA